MSQKWGYTIKFPDGWLDVPNYSGVDTEKYFSTDNAGAPSEISSGGIYFGISVNGKTADACLLRGLGNAKIERLSSVTVDGVTSPLYVATSEGFGELILNLQHSGYCYWFAYVFRSTQVRDATEPIARIMLSQTFKFGQPSASPKP